MSEITSSPKRLAAGLAQEPAPISRRTSQPPRWRCVVLAMIILACVGRPLALSNARSDVDPTLRPHGDLDAVDDAPGPSGFWARAAAPPAPAPQRLVIIDCKPAGLITRGSTSVNLDREADVDRSPPCQIPHRILSPSSIVEDSIYIIDDRLTLGLVFEAGTVHRMFRSRQVDRADSAWCRAPGSAQGSSYHA